MQRLLAQPVARENELAFRLVVNRKTEHAAQFLHAFRAHLFVEMNDDFGIGLGVEAMTALFQFGAELRKIVDFAIEDDPRAAVFVEYRLVAAGKVDDAEAAHSEPGAIGDVESFVVRTAVDDLLAHVVHQSFCNVALPSCAHHSGNSTHTCFSTLSQ